MNNRYRTLAIMLLAVGMITSLAACGNEGRINNSDSEDTSKSTMESTQTDNDQNGTGGEADMTDFDFSVFNNVEIIGINVSELSEEEQDVFTIGIENPVVNISDNYTSVSYTSVLNANAYGARGTYRIDGIHWYEKQGENWIACNAPKQERGR